MLGSFHIISKQLLPAKHALPSETIFHWILLSVFRNLPGILSKGVQNYPAIVPACDPSYDQSKTRSRKSPEQKVPMQEKHTLNYPYRRVVMSRFGEEISRTRPFPFATRMPANVLSSVAAGILGSGRVTIIGRSASFSNIFI
jgi:hypothetical protein